MKNELIEYLKDKIKNKKKVNDNIIKILINNNNINYIDENNDTALSLYLTNQLNNPNYLIVKLLITEQNINTFNKKRKTTLIIYLQNNCRYKISIIKLLVTKKILISIKIIKIFS
jgi:hypothetical protein